MGQLLVMLIVPPLVGVVTYGVVRLIWQRDKIGASEAVSRREPSAEDESRSNPTGVAPAAPVVQGVTKSNGLLDGS